MPYTKSKAGIGLGTVLSIGDGADPEVFIPVGEIKTIGQSGRQVATEDVTNLDSPSREFIPTLLDSGAFDLTGSRIGTDAGQIALEAAFAGLQRPNFTITLPKAPGQTTVGDQFEFSGLVQESNFTLAVDKSVMFSAKIKVSGRVAETPGS